MTQLQRHFSSKAVDVVTATAGDLRQLLDAGTITSEKLVQLYLNQIATHNHNGMRLHAITVTAPSDKLIAKARALDQERWTSGPRSSLHGIPITLKDFFLAPSYDLQTTCGSFALKGLNASEDAALATLLSDAGCIIIGLANLSEWANGRGVNLTSGWSAIGGLTQSPYVHGGVDPNDKWMGHSTTAGSSSGSAMGTAAGFSSLSIGSEAEGSIVQPAVRAALYSIKGTVGDVNMRGSMSGGAGFDSAGPLAKSVEDCVSVMEILLPGRDFRSHLTKSWEGIGIAYLDYKTWKFPDWTCDPIASFDREHETAMIDALQKIESLGGKVTYNAPLPMPDRVMARYKMAPMGDIFNHETVPNFKRFLSLFNSSKFRTLEDLIEFNKGNAELEFPPCAPNQSKFEGALTDKMTDEEYENGLKQLRESFRDAIEKCFDATGADIIMASGESLLPTMAAAAGYPLASVPLGFASYNGRPYGMEIMARNQEEEIIFKAMSAWEASFPEGRQAPSRLIDWDKESCL